MDIMEKHATNLEEIVVSRTNEVFEEKRKSQDLLHRMLPAYVDLTFELLYFIVNYYKIPIGQWQSN